jgi:hypothetical protein
VLADITHRWKGTYNAAGKSGEGDISEEQKIKGRRGLHVAGA